MELEEYAKAFKVNVGDIAKLKKSKRDGKLIAYNRDGKVILFDNSRDLHKGFVEITKVQEKKTAYIAHGRNVPFDFYCGIPHAEFEEVLKNLGFVEEYTKEFMYNTDDEEYPNKFKVYANVSRKMLITVETWDTKDEESYNSVNITFAINVLGMHWRVLENYGFSHGGGSISTFNLVNNTLDFPLHRVMDLQMKVDDWNGHTPSLWCYADGQPDVYPDDIKFYIDAANRIYDFKDDIDMMFNIRTSETIERYKANLSK